MKKITTVMASAMLMGAAMTAGAQSACSSFNLQRRPIKSAYLCTAPGLFVTRKSSVTPYWKAPCKRLKVSYIPQVAPVHLAHGTSAY